MKKTIAIFLFAFLSCSLFGQVDFLSKKTYLKAKVIDNQDNKIYIPFAHIFNESLRISAITDTIGNLKIRANEKDTIVITAIGYYPEVIILDIEQVSTDVPIDIILKRRTYAIQEVSVHALGTYQQFKKKVENLDMPHTKEEKLRAELKDLSKSIAKEAFYLAESERLLENTPKGEIRVASVPILTRNEKQLLKYKEMLKKEERKAVIYAKFNKTIIKRITKLAEPELTDFYVFCNFEENFLYKATEYEVGEAIKNKFNLYLAMKEEQDETTDSIPSQHNYCP